MPCAVSSTKSIRSLKISRPNTHPVAIPSTSEVALSIRFSQKITLRHGAFQAPTHRKDRILFPGLIRKAVDIEHISHSKQTHNRKSHCQNGLCGHAVAQICNTFRRNQIGNDKIHCRHNHRRNQIRNIQPPVAFQIGSRQTKIKTLSQCLHPRLKAQKASRQFYQRIPGVCCLRGTPG